jgi:PAS domain S-box-containing protein
MFTVRRLLNTRSKYIVLIAASLFLVLVLIVVGYARWSTEVNSEVVPLSDSERAWLLQEGELRFAGRWEEPPFGFFDEVGTYQGYEVDLAHSLGPVLGIAIEVVPMPPEEAVIAMENGEIDAMMGIVQDPQSSDRYGFTEPYINSSLSIIVRSERFDVTALEDLKGREVAVQVDTEAERVLAGRPSISSVPVQSVEEGLELLVDERVSALVADDIVGLRAAQLMGLSEEVKVVGLPTAVVNYSIAVRKTDDALLNVLNSAMASIEAVGLKQQVDRAWFGTSPSVVEVTESGPAITSALAAIVVVLVLGNVVYLLLKVRRRTEEYARTLQESQSKYRKLAEGTTEAVFSVSGDGSLLEINNKVEALTGYKKDELLRMFLEDLVVPAQRQAIRDCIERASREEVGSLDDLSLLHRHGDAVPVQVSAHMVSQSGRKIIQCIARDVGERKRIHHQVLRRSEDLSTIGAIANIVSHLANLEEVMDKVLAKVLALTQMESGIIYLSGSRDGEMIPVVKQGLTEELMKRMEWPQGPRELADEVSQHGQVLISTGPVRPPDSRGLGTEGTGLGIQLGVPLTSKDRIHGVMTAYGREPRRFTDEDTALLTAIGNQIGVAIENAQLFYQLQHTVSDMAAVKRFNDSILQNMTNGLVVIDEEGKVRLVNRAGEKLLGCKEGEVLGSGVEGVLGSAAEKVQDSLERSLVYSGEETVLKRGGGEGMPLRMSISPLRDDGGKLNGVVVMLSDLREEKALEEERRRLDRLAFLGEISAVMAHEIRNPLAGMGAGLQHLLTKFEEGDGKREAMERILKEGERVNRIIEDILLISRPPQLNLAPCDISEVIEEVVSLWEERAKGQGVEIRKYYASELPMVRGDKARLHQAFSNLISNGVEAMLDGGELSIAVTGPGREDVVGDGQGLGFWGEDGHVEVEIRDTGVGIKKEEMEKIFEPFYTTKVGGTGLGLAITRRIINEHGGEIEVESEEGVGTRFVVRLPLARRGG